MLGKTRHQGLNINLDKADREDLTVKGNVSGGRGNHHLRAAALQVLYGYFRALQCPVVKAVFPDIVPQAKRGIDPALCIHKGEFFQLIKLFDPGFKGHQVKQIGEVVFLQHTNGCVYIFNACIQVCRNGLLPAPRQLPQIKIADRVDRLLRAATSTSHSPGFAEIEDSRDQKQSQQSDKERSPFLHKQVFRLHGYIPPLILFPPISSSASIIKTQFHIFVKCSRNGGWTAPIR